MKNQNNLKNQIIEEVNKLITEKFPNENLTPLNSEMDNPNEISTYGVTARYVDEELYRMYLDFENIVVMGENIIFLSAFARNIKAKTSQNNFKKTLENIKNLFAKQI